MTGQRITYDKHCKLEFGTYVQSMKNMTTQWIQEHPGL